MGTAERRMEMMKLLCRKRHMTMPELAEVFGVSVRTVQRDIMEIELMGVPLEVRTGRYDGGVYVLGDYSMDHMYMHPDEIQLLNKVRKASEESSPLVFNSEEKHLLENLIQKYTKPSA